MDATEKTTTKSAFQWNAGAWFGMQFGCTAWFLTFAVSLMSASLALAIAGVSSFVILNAWGLLIWKSRLTLSAYLGIQCFLFGSTIVTTALVCLVKCMHSVWVPVGIAGPETSDLPYWIILLSPGLMGFVYLRERHAVRLKD